MLEMLDGLSEDAWEGVDSKSKADVDRFLEDLKARVAKFGLTLNEDKTRVLQFGRFAAEFARDKGSRSRRSSSSSVLPTLWAIAVGRLVPAEAADFGEANARQPQGDSTGADAPYARSDPNRMALKHRISDSPQSRASALEIANANAGRVRQILRHRRDDNRGQIPIIESGRRKPAGHCGGEASAGSCPGPGSCVLSTVTVPRVRVLHPYPHQRFAS
ncbi:MAG: hypothetical protein ACN6I7_04105 [bacterium]